MATQSSWRSQTAGTQRWGNGSASARSNNNNSSSHGTGSNSSSTAGHDAAAAAAAPSSGRQSGGATHTNAFPPLGAKSAAVDSHEATQRDRLLFLLVGLVGNTVVATTRTGVQYVGILSSTSTAAAAATSSTPVQDSLGIILSSAQEILPGQAPGQQPKLGPLKKMLVIQGQDLDSFAAKDVALDVPASMSRTDASAGFRTDTEISKTAEGLSAGRTLQKWTGDDGEALEGDGLGLGGGGAGAGVGAGAAAAGVGGLGTGSGGSWDQFAANEARFGVKSNYEETLYTTKLDKSAKDFKEKERRADQLAREIMNSSTNNIHVAEERDLVPQGGEVTEEDRYGAVVRGPNAYVPPAARRAAAAAAAASGTTSSSAAAPKAGNNGAEPGALTAKAKGEESETLPAVVTTAATPTQPTSKKEQQQQQQDAVGEFRQFVTQERERLEKKKAALAKKEKDSRLADLKSWGDKFKLKSPVPSDIALVTSRDADARPAPSSAEQGLAAASDKPRDPNLQKSLSPTTAHVQDKTRPSLDSSSPARQAGGTSSVSQSPTAPAAASAVPGAANRNVSASAAPSSASRLAESKAMLSKMTIPKIPPFNPDRIKARQAAAAAAVAAAAGGGGAAAAAAAASSPATADDAEKSATPAATGKSGFKLSAKASSFKPFNPAAAAFTPGGGGGGAAAAPATGVASPVPVSAAAPKAPSSVVSPALGAAPSPASSSAAPAAVAAPAPTATPLPPPHPFFGHRAIKKSSSTPSIHVREDFNPFKAYKVPEAHTIGPMWSFTGKPYRQLFNAVSPSMQGGMGLPGPSSVSDDASASATPHLAHHQPATGGPHMQQQQQQQQQPQQQQQQPQQTPQHQHQPPLQHQQHHHHHPSHQGHHHAPMHSHPPLPHHAPPHGGQPHHMQQHPQAMGMPPGGQGQNQAGGGPGAGQPFNVMYQPYGPYRFHGQQHMVQGMGMPGPHHHHPQHHQQGGGGGQMPYGGMPPQLMGQMPFSPPMPPHAGPPGGMYSPQMANMVAGPAGAGGGGPRPPPPPSSASSGAGGAAPPPGLQGGANNGGNKMPPQMYYHQQPMPGMPPYGGPMPPPPHMGGPHPPPPHAGGPMPPPGVGGPGGPPPPPSAMLSPAVAASTASTGSNTATSSTSTSNHAPSSAATTPSGKSSSSASTTTGGGGGAP